MITTYLTIEKSNVLPLKWLNFNDLNTIQSIEFKEGWINRLIF